MILLIFFTYLSAVLCQPYYSNYWAVQINGGIEEAKDVASRHGFEFVYEIIPGYYSFKHRSIRKRSVESSQHHHSKLTKDARVEWAEQQVIKKRVKRDLTTKSFNDPLWPDMWYMNDNKKNNMRVMDVYRKYNITGRGIKVTILDDGLEKDHPDIVNNYDPHSSYDVNDDDDDPQPSYDNADENRHGTRCAGEVAAEANNRICSVGIAYKASIGGVRMLDGDVTDTVESKSLGLNPQHIDIYSVSWGPEDNGKTVDGPGPLTRKTIFNGIAKGRNKLGNIFVWASGNGGLKGDSCGCDGYTNLIYTLSISSASEDGHVPWYSEPCASTLATTYSSGEEGENKIVTTDIRKKCTLDHTGTSASAPLAAGICALVLEANHELTWRDMQYIVLLTARMANLKADDWVINGVGKKVSHHFGYGLMDATAMVEAALDWSPLPEHHKCQTSVETYDYLENQGNDILERYIDTDGCLETPNSIEYLEHVECTITLQAKRRGDVEIFLTSPMGTRSQLLTRRAADFTSQGFKDWTFMTTHCWGENPVGEWMLEVQNRGTISALMKWSLTFYGVDTKPDAYSEYLPKMFEDLRRPPSAASNMTRHMTSDILSMIPSRKSTKQTKSPRPSKFPMPSKTAGGSAKFPGQIVMTCNESYYMNDNNTCVQICPHGYYANLADRKCKLCPTGCDRCMSEHDCLGAVVNDLSTFDRTFAIVLSSVIFVVFVVALIASSVLYSRIRKSRRGNDTDRSSNNRHILRNAFYSLDIPKDGYVPPIDSIKEPLLVDDVSSEDEGWPDVRP